MHASLQRLKSTGTLSYLLLRPNMHPTLSAPAVTGVPMSEISILAANQGCQLKYRTPSSV